MNTALAEDLRREPRDEQYADVFTAIATAETPPTRRGLELETHRSSGQIRRIVNELREMGRIRRVQDESDGRVYRYEIVAGGIDR